MRKYCIIFLSLFIITVTGLCFCERASESVGANFLFSGQSQAQTSGTGREDYFRIHIRADSNSDRDQAVKYLVRDQVVKYLVPCVAEFTDQKQAVDGVKKRLKEIENVAETVLKKQGFFYGASVSVRKEKFPTRVYGEYTLPTGEYTALIIELGSGKGDNWWCVVYPPLCFTAAQENVIYKSKILEIIQSFFT